MSDMGIAWESYDGDPEGSPITSIQIQWENHESLVGFIHKIHSGPMGEP